MADKMPIIDSHLHVWTQDVQAFPPSPEGPGNPDWDASVETLVATMDRCGVEQAVAINVRWYILDHTYLLDAARRYPTRIIPVARAHADDPDAPRKIRELVTQHGCRGIRLIWYRGGRADWPADPVTDRVWQTCAELGVAIGFLISGQIGLQAQWDAIGQAADRYPQVRVVIDHWGGLPPREAPHFPSFDGVAKLGALPNVFLKATCFRRLSQESFPFTDIHPLLRRALDAFGRDRVMWGTDFGGGCVGTEQYEQEVRAVRDHLDWLPPADQEWLLRRAAEAAWLPR